MVSVKGDSILGVVLAIIVLAILIWNVVYIGGVIKQIESGASINLSKSAAQIIFWVDIILIVLVVIFLIYNLFLIFTTKEQRVVAQETLIKSRADAPMVRTPVPGTTAPPVPNYPPPSRVVY